MHFPQPIKTDKTNKKKSHFCLVAYKLRLNQREGFKGTDDENEHAWGTRMLGGEMETVGLLLRGLPREA